MYLHLHIFTLISLDSQNQNNKNKYIVLQHYLCGNFVKKANYLNMTFKPFAGNTGINTLQKRTVLVIHHL